LSDFTAYLAPEGFIPELEHELGGDATGACGHLVIAPGPPRPTAWAQNIWYDPVRLPIASIGDAAKQLRNIQRNWALYSFENHRRATLIQEKLPKVSAKPLRFGDPAPTAPLGSWALLDPNTVIAAARCSSPFPNGAPQFIEDKVPPSRAYLKLWEAFTVLGVAPQPGEVCLDLGACPGGWSYVLAKLGAQVIAIDKAPLDPKVLAFANVEQRQQSAFALEPPDVGALDWFFSDVICYPSRLLTLVEKFIAAGTVKNFICTLKFQGDTDFETQAKFAAIPGSRLMHLNVNKHELTWVRLAA
jgi:23S rRNA (cytidine2498-2'-O)-methyltransferase